LSQQSESKAVCINEPARTEDKRDSDTDLEEREAFGQVDVEEPDKSDGLRVRDQEQDDERERGGVVQSTGDEFRMIWAAVTAQREELAAHHLVQQRVVRPRLEDLQFFPCGRSQAEPGGAREE